MSDEKPTWTVGTREELSKVDKSKNKVFVRLFYGSRLMHELSGPTALGSMEAYAKRANECGQVPHEELAKVRTRADGWGGSRDERRAKAIEIK